MSNVNAYNNTTTPVAGSYPATMPQQEKAQLLPAGDLPRGSRRFVMGTNDDPRTLFQTLYGDNARIAGGDAHMFAYLCNLPGGYPKPGDVVTLPPPEAYIGKQGAAMTDKCARVVGHLNEQDGNDFHNNESPDNRQWHPADRAKALSYCKPLQTAAARSSMSPPTDVSVRESSSKLAGIPSAAAPTAPMPPRPRAMTGASADPQRLARAPSLAIHQFVVTAPSLAF